MSRFESQVFTDKLASLKYCRENDGKFYAATIPGKKPELVFVVAVSQHQATLALVSYAMPLKQWNKKDQESNYINELEKAAEAGKMPLFDGAESDAKAG